VNHSHTSICEADDRLVTGLSFVEPRDMKVSPDNGFLVPHTELKTAQPVVVILRPGVVQLWTEESEGSAWSGLHSFSFHRQGISSGSSMFYAPSGLVYSPEHDTLVISLTDGSFHVIYDISSSPTVELRQDSTKLPRFSSSDLSSTSRRVFIQVEGGAITHAEMNRINGMVSFAGFPIVSWAHE
jgi:general transcription factor 3C polypeptide 4